LKKKME